MVARVAAARDGSEKSTAGRRRGVFTGECRMTKAKAAEISHPDKVFWPEQGYTKLDLADYYSAIFPKLLPYVRDRILALERCPDGMLGECFFKSRNRGACLAERRASASSTSTAPASSPITWSPAPWRRSSPW